MMPFLARYSQKENTEQYQYHSSAGMLHHWWKSLQSERRPGCTKGVWWYPLDQSHQWRGQRKLPYLLPNIWRNFLGKDFWMWGNSWRICRERREGREGKAWLWIYGASAKILSLHIYIAQYIYICSGFVHPLKVSHCTYIFICSAVHTYISNS